MMETLCEWCWKYTDHVTPIIVVMNPTKTGTRYCVCDKCLKMLKGSER